VGKGAEKKNGSWESDSEKVNKGQGPGASRQRGREVSSKPSETGERGCGIIVRAPEHPGLLQRDARRRRDLQRRSQYAVWNESEANIATAKKKRAPVTERGCWPEKLEEVKGSYHEKGLEGS